MYFFKIFRWRSSYDVVPRFLSFLLSLTVRPTSCTLECPWRREACWRASLCRVCAHSSNNSPWRSEQRPTSTSRRCSTCVHRIRSRDFLSRLPRIGAEGYQIEQRWTKLHWLPIQQRFVFIKCVNRSTVTAVTQSITATADDLLTCSISMCGRPAGRWRRGEKPGRRGSRTCTWWRVAGRSRGWSCWRSSRRGCRWTVATFPGSTIMAHTDTRCIRCTKTFDLTICLPIVISIFVQLFWSVVY